MSTEEPSGTLWHGRFAGGPADALMAYTVSLPFDRRLWRDDVAGSIPQALFLMNSPELARAMNGRQRSTTLGRLLADVPENRDLVAELYLRCLAREPRPAELATCLDHVQAADDRTEAFEDILWALVNSSEFLNRK